MRFYVVFIVSFIMCWSSRVFKKDIYCSSKHAHTPNKQQIVQLLVISQSDRMVET